MEEFKLQGGVERMKSSKMSWNTLDLKQRLSFFYQIELLKR